MDIEALQKKLRILKILFLVVIIICLPLTLLILFGAIFDAERDSESMLPVYFTIAWAASLVGSWLLLLFFKILNPKDQPLVSSLCYLFNLIGAVLNGFLAVPMGFIAARSISRAEYAVAGMEILICIIPLFILLVNMSVLNLITIIKKAAEAEEAEAEELPDPEEEIIEEEDKNAPDFEGITPLIRAVIDRDTALVKELCDDGKVDVDFISPTTGTTALWIAASTGNKEIVDILLWRGADAKSTNREGVTPKEIAHRNGFFEISHLISEHEN